MTEFLLPEVSLPGDLVLDLYRQNPWWKGNPSADVPPFRRWPFNKILERLREPLAPILVLRGPRQIGKTTLQQQVIEELLGGGIAPRRILRVQFDELGSLASLASKEPILRIVDWYEKVVLGETLNTASRAGRPGFLFFDEAQNLGAWGPQLKSLVDHTSVRVMVTGSSALRIQLGRDSLAGRIQQLEVGPLRLAEIAAFRHIGPLSPAQSDNGWSEWVRPEFWHAVRENGVRQHEVLDQVFRAFSERGGYPLAQTRPSVAWSEIADQLNETVIRRVIMHDLRMGERGRKRDASLLEDVFRMACRYAGQAPNPVTLAREAQHSRDANVGSQRIRHYLDFLDGSLLIRKIEPLEIRLKRRRAAPKICLCDHVLRAAWLQEVVPLDSRGLDQYPALQEIAGRIAESVAGYFLASLSGLDVAYRPARSVAEPEIDFVIMIGERRVPVEVKYRRNIDPVRDPVGLRRFIDDPHNHASFGLLVTRDDGAVVDDGRIICLPLKTLLTVR